MAKKQTTGHAGLSQLVPAAVADTRAVLYSRVSTTNGQDPEVQSRETREYCGRRGWKLTDEFVDTGISGAKERRPELDRLMADAHRRRFDVVVVWRFDRFARSVSFKLRGRKPRTGSIMAQDYLRPAAVKAGILRPDDRRRFGFHNLRHSLASYLVTQTKTDVKTVQSMLRHADISTTLDIYTHAINKDKLAAQNQVMEAMLKPGLVN